MPRFGSKSKKILDTCHNDIKKICNEVIKYYDFKILEGTRTLKQQQKYFNDSKSKCDGINKISFHQTYPSCAIDICPYPVDFRKKEKSRARFYQLSGYMLHACEMLYENGEIEYKIISGLDWNKNFIFTDENFWDGPHYNLKMTKSEKGEFLRND